MSDMGFRQSMEYIVSALREKGYDPYDQLQEYIQENDPDYITRHRNARDLIQKLDIDDIKQFLKEER